MLSTCTSSSSATTQQNHVFKISYQIDTSIHVCASFLVVPHVLAQLQVLCRIAVKSGVGAGSC